MNLFFSSEPYIMSCIAAFFGFFALYLAFFDRYSSLSETVPDKEGIWVFGSLFVFLSAIDFGLWPRETSEIYGTLAFVIYLFAGLFYYLRQMNNLSEGEMPPSLKKWVDLDG